MSAICEYGVFGGFKDFSFLGQALMNKNAWVDHPKKIEGEAKLLLEKELNRASRCVKEWKFSNRELNCSLEDVEESVVDIGVTINASWSARG